MRGRGRIHTLAYIGFTVIEDNSRVSGESPFVAQPMQTPRFQNVSTTWVDSGSLVRTGMETDAD